MSSEDDSTNVENKYNETFFVRLAFVILALSLFITAMLILFKDSLFTDSRFKDSLEPIFDFTELALLGDFLGGIITAFLTVSTILLVYATYRTQQKELSATNKQLKETVKQAEITNKTMQLQQFETTFFNMINMHVMLTNDLSIINTEIQGRDVIHQFYKDVNMEFGATQLKIFLNTLIFNNINRIDDLYSDYIDFVEETEYPVNYNNNVNNFNYINLVDFKIVCENIISGKTYDHTGKVINGLKAFNFSFYKLREAVNKSNSTFASKIKNEFIYNTNLKKFIFNDVNDQKMFPFSSYIKRIVSIISVVDKSFLNHEEKNSYLNIYFSTFTIQEISLLRYFVELGENDDLKNFFNKYESLNTKEYLNNSIL